MRPLNDGMKVCVKRGDCRLEATVVTTEGPDPDRPVGIVVKRADGGTDFEWVDPAELNDEFFVATYCPPGHGPLTRVHRRLEDHRRDFAPEHLIEIRQFTRAANGDWTSQPVTLPTEETPNV